MGGKTDVDRLLSLASISSKNYANCDESCIGDCEQCLKPAKGAGSSNRKGYRSMQVQLKGLFQDALCCCGEVTPTSQHAVRTPQGWPSEAEGNVDCPLFSRKWPKETASAVMDVLQLMRVVG